MTAGNGTSRRQFLSSSAAFAAGLSLTHSVHAAGSDDFRVALIGAGNRGTGATADCLRVAPNIKLVTVADAFENRARLSCKLLKERFGEQFAVPEDQVFVGLDAYQKALACDVDLAILTAPPGFRPLHYRAAVEAGTHVFMEKPLCVDAGSYRKMMDINKLADEKNRKVGVGLFRRHNPAYQEQMKQVHEGKIGKIQFLRCYCNMASWGAFPRKPGETEMEYQVRNWRVFDWLGGGRLVEAHCHELDVMDWAMKDHPRECNGMGGRTTLSSEPRFGEDYDHHFHEYTYADGTKMYSQSRTLNGLWSPISEHIHGDQGVIDLNGKIMKINELGQARAYQPVSQGMGRPDRRHLERQTVQRRLVRRDQQLLRRLGPRSQLLRSDRELGRAGSQGAGSVSQRKSLPGKAARQCSPTSKVPTRMPLPYRASTDPTDNQVRSVAKLDWHEQADGALTHIQLPFSETRNAGDTIKVSALISGHFSQGGMGVHLSVGDLPCGNEQSMNRTSTCTCSCAWAATLPASSC